MTDPWALDLRFTLGGGTLSSRDASILFTFLSPMSSSFRDHPRIRMRRSDVTRVTRPLAACGRHVSFIRSPVPTSIRCYRMCPDIIPVLRFILRMFPDTAPSALIPHPADVPVLHTVLHIVVIPAPFCSAGCHSCSVLPRGAYNPGSPPVSFTGMT